ncbi:thiamine-phosphate kinase [Aliivibrio sp. S4TY2]|uniref:thiamine-phosphate kinase n=1 Tax=unclassified Aliivibrio TaxID=2645654 RepID=UPI002379AE88|nr:MULTISPECIES: thiamine-phosphate kinase [unclassified Aliivibrio]MDD9157104.1 thiamine-phosphate kinase [Aliivibrio sp. S4TY2]MDD9161063.1 thiamine-phosphate kinase [Aliivibrio sp. S4TY1]MDD9165016.1 thiamine-phosphate kinase [Aliivibrio sp. S4MY2]MDD9169091.1 thiamine-phosphate kinase [Aliivibrio sp. S4MY4]MDD9185819.1 thiamine-phosphate kinase [Aliivibrio sp. S4MY3]
MSSEFNLIDRFFVQDNLSRSDVDLGIGDDCALVSVPEGYQVAITTDTLAAGTHFLEDADPVRVGYKALASNLSDLAAMGAKPTWVSLALTLPKPDEKWLEGFCEGFFGLAKQHNVQLIGGDTTKGPLSITITVQGLVPRGEALTRKGAKVGDDIYVTGFIGDSAAGLDILLDKKKQIKTELEQELERRHYYSNPKIQLAQKIRHLCHSALDISDGLISDLGHILKQSNVSAQIQVNALPISNELMTFYSHDIDKCLKMALVSGEEYELCFTAPKENREAIQQISFLLNQDVSIIGEIAKGPFTTLQNNVKLRKDTTLLDWVLYGYDHFRN